MNGFHGSSAHYFGSALGIVDVHPEKKLHHRMEKAAGKLALPRLRLVQDRSWYPSRADGAVDFVHLANQIVKGRRSSCSVGIDITNQICQGRELQSFD